MATQTHFDLNAAIETWRNELAAQPQLTSDDRRELEKHLTDSMAELRGRGLNDEETFWLARRRIGPPQQLAEEFEKADPVKIWRERLVWIVFSLIVLQVWGQLISCLFLVLNFLFVPRPQVYNSLPPQNLQNILNVLDFFFYNIPVIGVVALAATGRLHYLMDRFSLNSCSKAKIAGIATILVIASAYLNGLVNWWYYKIDYPANLALPLSIIGRVAMSNIARGLILVALLLWVLVQGKKTPKHGSSQKVGDDVRSL